jgi:BRCT domain type II-containing protein
MAPKRANLKAAPSIDGVAKAALLVEKKGQTLTDNTPKRPSKMTLSTAKDSIKTIPPSRALYAPAAAKAHHKHHRQASLHQRVKTP